MRNLTPTTLRAIPAATHTLADLESAYLLRRRELAEHRAAIELVTVVQELISERRATVLSRVVRWMRAPLATSPSRSVVHEMAPRRARDGRGRFLSRAWLEAAETITATDLAWFRGPIGAL